MRWLKPWIVSVSKLCFGTYFILTSLYCLLAFIPYTYFFLIKEPPSEALIIFVRYHLLFYWLAVAMGVFSYWEQRKQRLTQAAWALLAVIGIGFTATNYLARIQNNWAAYACSLLFLFPMLLLAGDNAAPGIPLEADGNKPFLLCYSNGVLVASIVAMVSGEGILIRNYCENTGSGFWSGLLHAGVKHDSQTLQLSCLVLANDLWITLAAISIVNLILIGATRISRRPQLTRLIVLVGLVFLAVFLSSLRFLQSTLNLQPWPARFYAFSFAATLTIWGLTLIKPFFESHGYGKFSKKAVLRVMGLGFCGMALAFPTAIGERDWNGILENAFTLLLLVAVGVSVYLLRPRIRNYSVPGILAVMLVAGSLFWGITESAFLWARQLGDTDGAIQRSMESYAADNSYFNMVYHWGVGARIEPCKELCLILRQYTNVHEAAINSDFRLVSHIAPTQATRPNIFIFVIDSLRPDYLGAYNPRVDFTPNLDAFARDSVVVPNAYSQYAGTSLSEPAIWAGSLILHSHRFESFDRLNSLKKLVTTDGYQMIVSYDEVLRQILPNDPDLVKLDADKPWNTLEIGATIAQLKKLLDERQNDDRPIFFYDQPKNVHILARNDRPERTNANWVMRSSFNNKRAFAVHQVDESLGDFFSYLKSRHLYENSIIIVTADHGDGNVEMGHNGHSLFIYPEVMRVPILIHLPQELRNLLVYDPHAIAALTDITPTLYYILGHRPILKNPLFGRPLLAETEAELKSYPRNDLLLASDSRAAFGILSGDGRFMYATYDSPAESYLFDLTRYPDDTQSLLTEDARKNYERRLIEYLQTIADFYGYKPNGNRTLLAGY